VAGIILVRHAPTAWTGSRYCGRSDPPLDAAGVAVAHRLADDRWREADFGLADGLTFEELERRAPDLARRLVDSETEIDWPDGERAADLAARVATAWRDLVTAGDEVLVVSHAGPLRIALGIASGRAPGTADLPSPGAVMRLSMTVPA
jgi:broad specificity phosphatase PhoE